MNEKELTELTDATVKAIKAEVNAGYFPTQPDWDLIWTLVGNALMEAARKGAAT